MTPARPPAPILQKLWLRQPSWWVVVIAGSLTVFFLVAIAREVVHGYRVRQQVASLQTQANTEEQRQKQLQDLLDYLASPTFQERQARLNLGLKKDGERVIIVPPSQNAGSESSNTEVSGNSSPFESWWQYFFGKKSSSTT